MYEMGTCKICFVRSVVFTGLLASSLSVGILAVTMRGCWCIAMRCGAIEWHGGCAPSSVGYELAYLLVACVNVITAVLLSNREGNFDIQ